MKKKRIWYDYKVTYTFTNMKGGKTLTWHHTPAPNASEAIKMTKHRNKRFIKENPLLKDSNYKAKRISDKPSRYFP